LTTEVVAAIVGQLSRKTAGSAAGREQEERMKTWMMSLTGVALAVAATVACAQQPAVAGDDPVVANIGDDVITESQLEELAGASLVSLRQQIYDAKVTSLKAEIFERLLVKAAASEDLTRDEYLEKRLAEKTTEPDEGEIVKIMTQYRARLAEDDLQARAQVVQALKQQQQRVLMEDLRKELFAASGAQILLEPPRIEIEIPDGTPTRGTPGAPIVLVEYTDYQCPFCNRVQPTITALMERYDGQILHVFKNLPLPNHNQAQLAGEAAYCAQDQGKYWEFHDWLFQNQRTMNRESMIAQAGEMGMDSEVFEACIQNQTYAGRVVSDAQEARSFGITGTPGFLVNGRVLTGAQPLETFEQVINEELDLRGIEIPERKAAEEAAEETDEEATAE
jgi:protein-disulfide isomerase